MLHPHPALRARCLTFALALAAIAGGCATPGENSGTPRDEAVITEAELREVFVADLYQAVERLRPLWLRSRGARSFTAPTQIAVVRDGVYFGDIEQLRAIPTTGVHRLEYVDGSTAAALIPGLVGQGRVVEAAILVTLGRPR